MFSITNGADVADDHIPWNKGPADRSEADLEAQRGLGDPDTPATGTTCHRPCPVPSGDRQQASWLRHRQTPGTPCGA